MAKKKKYKPSGNRNFPSAEPFYTSSNRSLTDKEKEFMTEHTRLGFEAVESSLTEEEYDFVKNICLYHHERIDGKGYEGIADLPLYVQIVSICDAYDALTSDRVYRDAMEPEKAIALIENGDCGCFDERIVEYLWKLVK